ncbi:glycosyltransferase [Haloferula sp.]|uniref:glycosyltransferase n=1 Tax=Haloferula sp. TaxID=2497595 RepID=UPI003C74EFC5
MRCLWITRQDPRSADSGDLIYSLGLLRSLAATGRVDLTVLTHRGNGDIEAADGIKWDIQGAIPPKNPLSLLSSLPSDAHRLGSASMRSALKRQLAKGRFDRIVIDQAASAWALDDLPEQTPVLYVAHNHEAIVRNEVAASREGSFAFQLALKRDASNYAKLERRLCKRASIISAITPRDESNFRREFGDKTYVQLTPGYDGPIPSADLPLITSETPRRVVLAGTFEWLAKRRNLEAFLAAANAPFPKAGIEFLVVGKSDPDYFVQLAKEFPWARFEANVPSMERYLRDARIGLIPEALGGGFKLKALDYIFRGLPLAALEPALSGLPLKPGIDALVSDTTEGLVKIVSNKIDDLGFLNQTAASSLAHCRDAFHWSARGKRLADALCA